MPELPEVEVVRRGLADHVVGRRISAAGFGSPRVWRRHLAGPEDLAGRVAGNEVVAAERRGKYLWLVLRAPDAHEQALVIHLGMSGQLLVEPADAPARAHLHARFDFADDGPQLRFVDQRTFGGMALADLVPDPQGGAGGGRARPHGVPHPITHIAPDPLEPAFDQGAFLRRLKARHTEVKRALLDQGLVSGIGNIYADEALWRARVHGRRQAADLSRPRLALLLERAREVMLEALGHGGTSFDALYVDVNGRSGYFDRSLHAYGRAGRPCSRCGTPITREAFMNRSSFSCPRCQPRPRRRRAGGGSVAGRRVGSVSDFAGLPALSYPADPDGWSAWLAQRCAANLDAVRGVVEELKAQRPAPAGQVLQRWNDASIALSEAFSASSSMANVHPDPAVRSAAEAAEQEAQKVDTDLSLDRDLYDVLVAADPAGLDADASRLLAHTLRDFRRAGVDRDDATRSRLREISERLTTLTQDFARNIREDVRSVAVRPTALDGLPQDYVDAHPPGADGLVRITTDYPDYVPFRTFSTDAAARRELLLAFLNRAWPGNDAVLREMLDLRAEQARLLGYDDWPDYDTEVKMIRRGQAVADFIERITAAAEEPGRRDIEVLLRRKQQDDPSATGIDGADSAYYAELVRKEQYDVDAQRVRRYFDFAKVRAGLLDVTGRLFGLEYRPVDVPTWHPDVASYDVVVGEDRIGRIHLDLHPREGKYKHAAQFDLARGVVGRQLPEGALVCNFSRGLMEHDEVVTLFHEFGHLVHHVLGGRQRWIRFSGVATEWDFVEAPSQMLEEWAWDADVLRTFASDEAGEPIPVPLVDKMRAAKDFGEASRARTQMFYAAVSYWLHRAPGADLTAQVRQLQERYDLQQPVDGTHMHASFGHLDGYTSGYYTYMWSLVIAKDLFSAFDPADLFDPEVAGRYRDAILAQGGRRDAADLVADFLGRPYSFDAFAAWLAGAADRPAS